MVLSLRKLTTYRCAAIRPRKAPSFEYISTTRWSVSGTPFEAILIVNVHTGETASDSDNKGVCDGSDLKEITSTGRPLNPVFHQVLNFSPDIKAVVTDAVDGIGGTVEQSHSVDSISTESESGNTVTSSPRR